MARASRAMAAIVLVAGLAAGCASSPHDDADEQGVNDPLEGYNRAMFEVNRTLDETLMKPVAIMYRGIVPEWGRDRVNAFLNNLGEPVNMANEALQGEFESAGVSLGRFVMNTLLGFFGTFDVAKEAGLPYRDEDFGQTLAIWGAGEGPYIVLPLFGPSNPRDAAGLLVDFFIDPWGYFWTPAEKNARFIARAIDTRSHHIEDLDAVEKTSIDFYSEFRDLYRQKRDNDIRNGDLPELIPVPSVTFDDTKSEQLSGEAKPIQ
jgi:phospholipid-binding lipoprotein MlaA